MTNDSLSIAEKMRKQSNLLMRWVFIAGGTLFLGLAILGIFLPVLPTTPFLLLSAALYMRSSDQLFQWMTNHPFIKPHYDRLKNQRGMTRTTKISVLALAWTMLILAAIFMTENFMLRTFLIGLGVVKTIVIAKIKTIA